MDDKTKLLLKDVLSLIEGVENGMKYTEEYYVQDYAGMSEILSFFNGYAGSPDWEKIKDRIILALQEDEGGF